MHIRDILGHIFEKHRICPKQPSKHKKNDSIFAKYFLKTSKRASAKVIL